MPENAVRFTKFHPKAIVGMLGNVAVNTCPDTMIGAEVLRRANLKLCDLPLRFSSTGI